jgi:hypothetical protein
LLPKIRGRHFDDFKGPLAAFPQVGGKNLQSVHAVETLPGNREVIKETVPVERRSEVFPDDGPQELERASAKQDRVGTRRRSGSTISVILLNC